MKKKIRNKTKLFGLFVSVLAVGTFAAAMSEHVTSVGANDGTYQAYSDPTEAFISQIGESARQLGQENDLYASVMIAVIVSTAAPTMYPVRPLPRGSLQN